MYTPTKQELEKLGFKYEGITGHENTFRYIIRLSSSNYIMYFDNEFDVGIKQAYPESLEDLKTLIKLFTPK